LKNIYAVTVTYGNRFKYLIQVIDSLIEQGIDKIVIVLNGSEESSLLKIKELKNKFDCIELIDLEKNTGSANGFSKGIEFAYNENADFIWLLDDDNCPKNDALSVLKSEWLNLVREYPKQKLALLSYRNDRKIYSDAINLGNTKLMLGSVNSFLGFSFLDKITNIFTKKKSNKIKLKDKGIVAVAPYGGLFFHRDLIPIIGLPDKSYFLYGDDYDYSYRISKNSGKIFLIMRSKIVDLEKSFHLIQKTRVFSTKYFNTNSKDKIFYSVRNGIIFEQNFVNNLFIYFFNSFIYLVLLFVLMILNPGHLWKFKYIIKGIFSAIHKIR